MGYDFEWVELPLPAAARTRWRDCPESGAPCDHRPPCEEAYSSLAHPFRFQLTTAAMGFCLDAMTGTGTGMSYSAQHRPFPSWPFAGFADWESADPQAKDLYRAAERRVRAQSILGRVGIPSFKLESNDSWLVGPEEIGQALERYEASSPPGRAELEAQPVGEQWLRWLRGAVGHGGFTVD